MGTKPYLTLAEVDRIAVAARQSAQTMGCGVTIAIVDDGGYLLRLDRLDGAPLVSLRVAAGKAHTAAHFRAATSTIGEYANALPSIVAIPDIFPFTGGIPISIDGICVGAVGVSGADGLEDEQVARAGVDALT